MGMPAIDPPACRSCTVPVVVGAPAASMMWPAIRAVRTGVNEKSIPVRSCDGAMEMNCAPLGSPLPGK